MSDQTYPTSIMLAAAKACADHNIPAMGAPFIPSAACFVAMAAIEAERKRCQEEVTAVQNRIGDTLTSFGQGAVSACREIAERIALPLVMVPA